MAVKSEIQQSITDQIYDEFLTLLQGHTEFDSEVIERLRQLALHGDLRRSQQVVKAIKASPEQKT
jgi:hypothetical protein